MAPWRGDRGAGLPACAAAALLLVAVLSAGCTGTVTPSGEIETQTREVGSFDRVVLSGAGMLTIKPGKTASLTIRADKNVMPFVASEVSGNELELGIDAGGRVIKLDESSAPEFELTAPSITAIENSGSGRIVGGSFSGGLFTIVHSGSGVIELDEVSVLNLDTTVSGSGTVRIGGGLTGAQVVNVSGSGSFEAADLECKVAMVKISGSGSVELWATEGLDASVSGSGNVSYWGDPRLTEQTIGSGQVESLGPKS